MVDLSLAPTPAIGDSVADILEEMGQESVEPTEQRQPLLYLTTL